MQLSAMFDQSLVGGLLDSYEQMLQSYLEGRDKAAELEAAHFAERAFRICEEQCSGTYTPLNKSLPSIDKLVAQLASAASGHDTFKLHIPRILFGVYDIRNRRGVGHPSGDVNPNRADSELLRTTTSWVLAELLRHACSIDLVSAQALIDHLVQRRVPFVEEIDGFPRILRAGIPLSDRILVLLLHFGRPLSSKDLRRYARTASGNRLTAVLKALDKDAFIHKTSSGWVLTSLGVKSAERIVQDQS